MEQLLSDYAPELPSNIDLHNFHSIHELIVSLID